MNAPLFPSSRPNLVVRAQVRIPATMVGAGGIAIEKESGIWTVHPQWEDLILIAPGVALNPASREIWVRDPLTNVYNRMTLSGLGQALWTGTSTTTQQITPAIKNFITQAGKDWAIGSYVMTISVINPNLWMVGQVTAYSGVDLQISVPNGSLNGLDTIVDNWLITKSTPLIGATAGAAGEDAGLAYVYLMTTGSDPGVGRVGFNSPNIALITSLFVNHLDRNSNNLLAEIDTWDTSNSSIKARVRVYSENNANSFIIGSISGPRTDNGTYSKFPIITDVVGPGIIDGDNVRVEVLRVGDSGVGEDGPPGPAGPQGDPGPTGATGSQGPAGATGSQGPAGSTGPQGVPGTPGATGSQGPQGPAGLDGVGSGASYHWSTGLSGDPGAGNVGGNNAALASITSLRINKTTFPGQDIGAYLLTLDDSSTIANRGVINLVGATAGTQGNFAQYRISGDANDGGTFVTFPVVFVNSAGSFASGFALQSFFSRTGDRGTDGVGAGDMLGAVNLAQGAGGVANTNTAVTNLGIVKRTAISNTDYTILPTDRYVMQAAGMTANRTFTLPLANSVLPGQTIDIWVTDVNGFIQTIQRQGTDNIYVPGGGSTPVTSFTLTTKGASARLASDGSSWQLLGSGSGGGGDMLGSVNLAQGAGGVANTNTALLNLNVIGRTIITDANYTALTTDRYIEYFAALTANRTITLPAVGTMPDGKWVTIYCQDAGAFALIISAGAAVILTPGGAAPTSIQLTKLGTSVTLMKSGGGWFVIGGTAIVAGGSGGNVLWGTTSVGDGNYSSVAADRHIQYGTPLTANRTLTLIHAGSVPVGQLLTVYLHAPNGFSLTVSTSANLISNGVVASIVMNQASSLILKSDGGSWIVVGGSAIAAGGTAGTSRITAHDNLASHSTIAVANPLPLDGAGGNILDVTGTGVAITSVTLAAGRRRLCRFMAAGNSIVFTPGSLGILGGSGTLTPAAFDIVEFIGVGGGVAYAISWMPGDKASWRSYWGLGTAAQYNVGHAATNVPDLDANGWLNEDDVPGRLGANARIITDWNTAITSGWFMGSSTTNGPGGGAQWFLGHVQVHNPNWVTQTVHEFANSLQGGDTLTWRRQQRNGVWDTAWVKVYQTLAEISPLIGLGVTQIGDSDYTILPTDRTVNMVIAPTATRTFTLPLNSSVPLGTIIRVMSFYIPGQPLVIQRQGPDVIVPVGAASGVVSVTIGADEALASVEFMASGNWLIVGGTAIAGGGNSHYTRIGAWDMSQGPITTVPVAPIIDLNNTATPNIYLSGTNTAVEQIILGIGKRRIVYVGGPSTGNSLKWLSNVAGGNIVTQGSADMPLAGGDMFEVIAPSSGQVKIHGWTTLSKPLYRSFWGAGDMSLAGNQNITGGFSVTTFNAGNFSNGQTYTPNPMQGNYQYFGNVSTAGQNVNVAVPTVDCAIDVLVQNAGATVGSITFTGGWVAAGAAVPSIAANAKYILSIRKIIGIATYAVSPI